MAVIWDVMIVMWRHCDGMECADRLVIIIIISDLFEGIELVRYIVGRTMCQPNYPNQLAPEWGKPEEFGVSTPPHLVRLSVQSLYCSALGHSQQGRGLISPLYSPAFDRAFDHLQLWLEQLWFSKKKKQLYKANKLCSYQCISEEGVVI